MASTKNSTPLKELESTHDTRYESWICQGQNYLVVHDSTRVISPIYFAETKVRNNMCNHDGHTFCIAIHITIAYMYGYIHITWIGCMLTQVLKTL